MLVYRLSREKYAKELSGYGASIAGARWNSKGVEMLYCACNKSLAMAEVLVHLTFDLIPNDFMMLSIKIPDTAIIDKLDSNCLSKNWNTFPYVNHTQKIGDKFIHSGHSLALQVPSAVTQGDYNILINPHHQLFKKIKIIHAEKFLFNDRFFIS